MPIQLAATRHGRTSAKNKKYFFKLKCRTYSRAESDVGPTVGRNLSFDISFSDKIENIGLLGCLNSYFCRKVILQL